MKKIIVGNWKMNPQTYKEAEDLISEILKHADMLNEAEVVLCPPFAWLTDFSHKIKEGVAWGAQNVFWEEKGAYTGEISTAMLKGSNVSYVIVGHSERRKYFGETNDIVNKKLKAVLGAGLTPILCVGENEGKDREEVLRKQITEGLAGVSDFSNLVIAYEPVWAISSGDPYATKKLPTAEEAKIANECVKKILGDNAKTVRIIYGGSANAANAKQYLEVMDGLLIGGASLKAEEFLKIIQASE